jgi:uroporphyrinogen decarboxylase
VIAALEHRQPDRTPFHVDFTQRASAHLLEHDPAFDFGDGLDNHLTFYSTEPAGAWRQVEPDVWEDQFGVRWNRSIDKDIGNVCNQVVTPGSLAGYRFPDPEDPSRYAAYDRPLPDRAARYVVVNLGFSLFERAWTLAGMETLLESMATDPGFVHGLLDRILEFNLEVIARACGRDIDAMMFGDDWGMQRGLIMGPERWRQFIKPRVRRMYGLVKSKGRKVFIHSCGKVEELFPDLIECGVDVFNPFQPEVIDVFAAKRRYGAQLSFFGGISTQRALPYATPAQVRDEVRRLLAEVGRDGGYIAAPAHAVPADARPENVVAMLEVLHQQ